MKKFHTITYGCQMNYADTARIKTILKILGFKYTSQEQNADIVILVTCSVRQKSEDKITGYLKQISPKQKIWLCGCMIQHNFRNSKLNPTKPITQTYKKGNFLGNSQNSKTQILGLTNEELKNIKNPQIECTYINHAFNPMFNNLHKTFPNIELFWRIDDTGLLPNILKKIGYKIPPNSITKNEYNEIIPNGIETSMLKHKTSAYIPISTGCNQFCSYCIVPYTRGFEKNYKPEQIINETKSHIKNGAKEIYLLGQIVNKHPNFYQILKDILKIKGLKRLRYTSPYPTYYKEEIFKLHETENKLCPHIHIPIQSGSDKILKKMFRGYNTNQIKKFLDNIKKLKRKISLTTDIIVGFPDETDEDFKKTLDIIKYGNFDMIYIGIYSPRPGTYAHENFKDNIPNKIKQTRWEILNNILSEISQKNNKQEIGTKKEILINNIINEQKYEGHTDSMKQINVNSKEKLKPGNFITANIIDSTAFKLIGKKI